MRELILNRIEEIGKRENNFSQSLMRWREFYVGQSKTHISVYNFDACPDEDLVKIFERVVRRYYTQM